MAQPIMAAPSPRPGGTELISGEQVHDGRDIAGFGPAQNHRGAAQLKSRQIIHHPKLPAHILVVPQFRPPGNSIAEGLATGQDKRVRKTAMLTIAGRRSPGTARG